MGSCFSCLFCMFKPRYKQAKKDEDEVTFSDEKYPMLLDDEEEEEEDSTEREHPKKRHFSGPPICEREKRVAVEERYIKRQQTRAARLRTLSLQAPDELRRRRTEKLLGRTIEQIVESKHDRDLLLGKTSASQGSEKHSKDDKDNNPQIKGAPKFNEKWYCPGTNREQAESWLLEQHEDGTFLVRDKSEQSGNAFILSVLHRGEVHHLNITGIADKTWVLGEGGPQDKTHKSVENLIKYHSKKPVHFESGGTTILKLASLRE